MNEKFDTVVIGGGQAGLAAGYFLSRQGRDYTILDANARTGDSWRLRWDSLRLFTPAKYSSLPGMPFPASPRYIPSKDEMADYLEAYAARFNLPVRHGIKVEQLVREDDRYLVKAGERSFETRQVIVATGGFPHPKVPDFAKELDTGINQIHSSQYRQPSQLQPGDTLVVGVGNSGGEIAMDLAKTHRVWLAGSPPGMVPELPSIVHPILWWFMHNGSRIDRRLGMQIKKKVGGKGTPLERITEKDFAEAGISRLPRATGAQDGMPVFADGSRLEPVNIIWATGFRQDFTWIKLPVFDPGGLPVHRRGVVEGEPGLYFLGLVFLYSISSGLIGGAGRDAEYIVSQIAARDWSPERQAAGGKQKQARSSRVPARE